MLSLSGHVRLTSKEQGRIYIYLVNYENLTGNAKNSGYRKLSRFVWSVTENMAQSWSTCQFRA